jgi:Uma2 family endonuclease
MSAHVEQLFTVADLELMPDDGQRYELIGGDLVVSHAPGLSHQAILDNLIWHIKNYLASNSVGKAWSTPGVIFDNYNAVIPDLVFVSNERLGQVASTEKVTGAPDLAIEVLSPGAENLRRDRSMKLKTYGKFGVSEYWIVDGFQRLVEVYHLAVGDLTLTTVLRFSDELTSALLPGFTCEFRQIFEA